jgi:NitT/TauT family transport system permease protein
LTTAASAIGIEGPVETAGASPASVLRSKLGDLVAMAVVFAILVGVWYLAAIYYNYGALARHDSLIGTSNSWNRLGFWRQIGDALNYGFPTLPAPHQVLASFWSAAITPPGASGSIWSDYIATGEEAIFGFLLGAFVAIGLGFLFVRFRLLELSLFPYVVMSQTVPIVALTPVLLHALGLGLRAKLLIAAYLAFYPITVSAVKGLRSVDPLAEELMRSYAGSGRQAFLKLQLPTSLPYLFTGFKIGVAASLIGAIIAELPTGSLSGFGWGIINAFEYDQNILLWTMIVGAATLGLALYFAVVLLEKAAVHTRREAG